LKATEALKYAVTHLGSACAPREETLEPMPERWQTAFTDNPFKPYTNNQYECIQCEHKG
jgi:hypothetical protein